MLTINGGGGRELHAASTSTLLLPLSPPLLGEDPIPSLFSLRHPLDELKPVAVVGGRSEEEEEGMEEEEEEEEEGSPPVLLCDAKECVIWTQEVGVQVEEGEEEEKAVLVVTYNYRLVGPLPTTHPPTHSPIHQSNNSPTHPLTLQAAGAPGVACPRNLYRRGRGGRGGGGGGRGRGVEYHDQCFFFLCEQFGRRGEEEEEEELGGREAEE